MKLDSSLSLVITESNHMVYSSHGIIAKVSPNIEWEYFVYQELSKLEWKYSPRILYKGPSVLYMEEVGDCDVEHLLWVDRLAFSYYQEKCITVLEELHSLGWIHGDPHWNNWRVDLQTEQIWLIDYEKSFHRSMDPKGGNECPKEDMYQLL